MAEVPTIEGAQPTNDNSVAGLSNRQEKLETLMQYVVLVLLLMTAGLVVTVGGIVIDAYENKATKYETMTQQMHTLQDCLAKQQDC